MRSLRGRWMWAAFIGVAGAAALWAALLRQTPTPRRLTVYPVVGTLTIDGQRAAQAKIALHPLDATGDATIRPVAVTGADGTFQVMTYVVGDGAPAGAYAVTIVWPHPEADCDCEGDLKHDRLKGQYADPNESQLQATVSVGHTELRLAAFSSGSWLSPRKRDRETAPKERKPDKAPPLAQ